MSDDLLSFYHGEEFVSGERLDKFLSLRLNGPSRSQIQKWIKAGLASVNGEPTTKNSPLKLGDRVEITVPPEPEVSHLDPENIPLNIVYEDEFLAVVDKPKGMVTHPGNGVPSGTLANALAYHFRELSDIGGADRPGIVHRLDRDTSGLLVVARDNVTHAALSHQLSERNIKRTYEALCWREPSPEGTYDWPLGRNPMDPLRRAVREDGKPAMTHYRVLAWFQFAAHLEVRLQTGRTHQIRVHLSHARHPVVGDTLYGGGESMLGRLPPLFQTPAAGLLKRLSSQALHAAKLAFVHPRTDEAMEFQAPHPQEFQDALDYLQAFKRKPDDI
jgi:23S rRNA pseudouridine1911/1915/1917 synthase